MYAMHSHVCNMRGYTHAINMLTKVCPIQSTTVKATHSEYINSYINYVSRQRFNSAYFRLGCSYGIFLMALIVTGQDGIWLYSKQSETKM